MNVHVRNAAIMRLRECRLPARVIAALNWCDYTKNTLIVERHPKAQLQLIGTLTELDSWKREAIDTRNDKPIFVACDNRSLGSRLTEQSILKIEREVSHGRV